MCFSMAVGSHHHACTGCFFAVSGEAMLLAGCCTGVRLFPHEQVPPPSSGQVPTIHGARTSEGHVLWVSQLEFNLSQQLTNEESTATVVTQAGPIFSYARGLESTVFISLRVWSLLPLV